MLVKGMNCCKMRSVSDEVLDQLTAHFLFLITNDLDGADVAKLHKPGLVPWELDADPLTITSIINKCRIHIPVCLASFMSGLPDVGKFDWEKKGFGKVPTSLSLEAVARLITDGKVAA